MRKLITMRDALASEGYFGRLLSGDSWRAWRTLLVAIVGEELTEDERAIFESLTGRPTEPAEPLEEFWAVIRTPRRQNPLYGLPSGLYRGLRRPSRYPSAR